MVFDQIKGKLDAGFEDFGMHQVKNIADPVRTYRVASASVSNPSTDHIPAPTKPSIAVLPFDNMSDDHAQEYFSDGISEDLTTALSRFECVCNRAELGIHLQEEGSGSEESGTRAGRSIHS